MSSCPSADTRDLFLRAQQPVRAALIALRQCHLQDAAELFEKAGSRERAADLYKQCGMKMKADELRAEAARDDKEERLAARRKELEDEDAGEQRADEKTGRGRPSTIHSFAVDRNRHPLAVEDRVLPFAL